MTTLPLPRALLLVAALVALLPTSCAGCFGPSSMDAGPIGDVDGGDGTNVDAGPSGARSLSSSDGAATLELPAGALPPGVDASEITLSALDPATRTSAIEGATTVVAYQLEPDGLVLLEPATLRIAVEDPEADVLRLPVHMSGDGSVVELPEAEWIADEDGTTLAVTVPHFSAIAVEEKALPEALGAALEVEISQAPNTIKDGTTGSGLLRHNELPDAEIVIAFREGGPCQLEISDVLRFSYRWTASGNLVESPQTFSNSSFTCIAPGRFQITGQFNFAVRGRWLCEQAAGSEARFATFARASKSTEAVCIDPEPDNTLDWIESISALGDPEYLAVWNDLVDRGIIRSNANQPSVDGLVNDSIFECGEVNEQGFRTVCPPGVQDMPAGDLITVTATHAADLPAPGADDGHHFVYAAVFDSDDSTANNWVPQGPYDWDYFQGADRWYQLSYEPDGGTWSLAVSQVDEEQNIGTATSSVRAVLKGDTITWLISASELPGAAPGYRVTAFGHDGAYSEDDRGGDVSGANPTEPLDPVPLTVPSLD